MSFNIEFIAKSASDARAILEEEHLPQEVKAFILKGLTAFPKDAVLIKAIGHLFNDDYTVSTANISVSAIILRSPK